MRRGNVPTTTSRLHQGLLSNKLRRSPQIYETLILFPTNGGRAPTYSPPLFFASLRRIKARQAVNPLFARGSARTRFPVAAAIAFTTAGATGG